MMGPVAQKCFCFVFYYIFFITSSELPRLQKQMSFPGGMPEPGTGSEAGRQGMGGEGCQRPLEKGWVKSSDRTPLIFQHPSPKVARERGLDLGLILLSVVEQAWFSSQAVLLWWLAEGTRLIPLGLFSQGLWSTSDSYTAPYPLPAANLYNASHCCPS